MSILILILIILMIVFIVTLSSDAAAAVTDTSLPVILSVRLSVCLYHQQCTSVNDMALYVVQYIDIDRTCRPIDDVVIADDDDDDDDN